MVVSILEAESVSEIEMTAMAQIISTEMVLICTAPFFPQGFRVQFGQNFSDQMPRRVNRP